MSIVSGLEMPSVSSMSPETGGGLGWISSAVSTVFLVGALGIITKAFATSGSSPCN